MVSVSDFNFQSVRNEGTNERKTEGKSQPTTMKWTDFSKLMTEEAEVSDLLECLFLFLERVRWRGEKEGVLIKNVLSSSYFCPSFSHDQVVIED